MNIIMNKIKKKVEDFKWCGNRRKKHKNSWHLWTVCRTTQILSEMFEMSLIPGTNNGNKTFEMFKKVKEIFNTAQISVWRLGFQVPRSSMNAFCLLISTNAWLLGSWWCVDRNSWINHMQVQKYQNWDY